MRDRMIYLLKILDISYHLQSKWDKELLKNYQINTQNKLFVWEIFLCIKLSFGL